ncbi:MAG: hypothetical protein ABUT39_07065 [Acidobacteriota bacterium]
MMRPTLSLFALAFCLTVPLGFAGAGDEPGVIRAAGSGPSEDCQLTRTAQPSLQEARVFEAAIAGTIHVPTPENRIAVVCINIPTDLSLGRLILEWDVTPGQWNSRFASGSHNLAWIHRGSYSGNTIGNVNVFGKGRNFIGMNQNVDMKTGAVSTGRLRNVDLALGGSTTYHLVYTYDAASRKATFQMTGAGRTESTEFAATARDGILQIPRKNRWSDSSLFIELGHYGEPRPSNGKPAVPTYGWRYSNLRLKMIQR